MKRTQNDVSTLPLSGERLQQHRRWMRVMAEGELTPASSVNRFGVHPLKAADGGRKTNSSSAN